MKHRGSGVFAALLFVLRYTGMNFRETYGYGNPFYAPIRDPARAVIAAYQTANRFLDTAQEYAYIEEGMPNLAAAIHRQAHKYPLRFDDFADMLHERHLMAEYPATPELDWREELKSVNDVFALVLRVMDSIHEALEGFRNATDNGGFREMALKAEELMLQNSQDCTKFLEAWARWDTDGGSKTSFDSWCREYFTEDGDKTA